MQSSFPLVGGFRSGHRLSAPRAELLLPAGVLAAVMATSDMTSALGAFAHMSTRKVFLGWTDSS